MVLEAIKEQILEDLGRLAPDQQMRAAELVHGLVEAPQGVSGSSLARFAGTLDEQSVREMTEAIDEGCERVRPDDW